VDDDDHDDVDDHDYDHDDVDDYVDDVHDHNGPRLDPNPFPSGSVSFVPLESNFFAGREGHVGRIEEFHHRERRERRAGRERQKRRKGLGASLRTLLFPQASRPCARGAR